MVGPSPPDRRGFPLPSGRQLLLTAVLVVAAVLVGTIAVLHRASSNHAAEVAESRDQFMNLAALPGLPAPNFTLTDQYGRRVSLSGFARQGKEVVLEFMDTHCTDICPIVSQEFVIAHQALGPAASRVAFVAVNVNPFHASQADVASFSAEHGLSSLPDWYFLTGPVPALRSVWKAYGVAVQAPSPDVDVVHSDNMYFIDTEGRERYLALPTDYHTASGAAYLPAGQVEEWGQDIASVAEQVLG